MRKWIGRIGEGLGHGLIGFVVTSILYKLIFKEDDWLYRSLVLSITDAIAIPIKYYSIVDKKCKKRPTVISAILAVMIITLFITGVCLSIVDYGWHTFRITFFFGWAMIFIPIDEENDKKREYRKDKVIDTCKSDIVV